ncbi:hypothetical protein JCM10908_004484 [Rhodotorula pacifica]|uniref:uncharacterized protein n=1 Tax=Rhodotorula pacifica TaxID=1495444 RepID=UPI00317E9E32
MATERAEDAALQAAASWYIYGVPELNLLLFTRERMVHACDGQPFDISQAPSAKWTPAMEKAHEQINNIGGPVYYAHLLDAVIEKLVAQTVGAARSRSTAFTPAIHEVTQFCIKAVERQEENLPPCFTTLLPAIPYPVGVYHGASTRFDGGYMQYVLPSVAPNGALVGNVRAARDLAGPYYVHGLRVVNKDGQHIGVSSRWPTQGAFASLVALKTSPNGSFGPHRTNPHGRIYSPFSRFEYELWPLGDPVKALRWKTGESAKDPPARAQWALKTTSLSTEYTHNDFAAVLSFELHWPPAALLQHLAPAESPLIPTPRPAGSTSLQVFA